MFTYAIGVAFFLVLWAIAYLVAPRCRSSMLAASLAFGHFGPLVQHWYLQDYWRPDYAWAIDMVGMKVALEDYLFAFAFTGVVAAIHQFVSSLRGARLSIVSVGATVARLQLLGGLWLLSFLFLTASMRLNSVRATVVVCVIGGFLIVHKSRAEAAASLITAFLAGILIWMFYEAYFLVLYPDILRDWWVESALSGIYLGGVPIEEVAWASAIALYVGPALRAASGFGSRNLETRLNLWRRVRRSDFARER